MKTILIVDDEPFIRNFLKVNLERQMPDLQVIEAGDGDSAWDKAHNQHVDLITIDINMPFVNGIELIRMLRKETDLKKIPIIVVTAHTSDEIKARLNKMGVKIIISKMDVTGSPVTNNPLAIAIRDILELH